MPPWKRPLYAVLVEYWPLAEKCEIWESSAPGCWATSERRSQSNIHSEISITVNAPWISEIQAWPVRTSSTVLLGANLNTRGARLAILWTWIHLSVQIKVFAPSLTLVVTAIEKYGCSDWTLIGNFNHGWLGSIFCNHSQRILRAQPRFWRLEMPRPPSSRGREILAHASRLFIQKCSWCSACLFALVLSFLISASCL